MGVINRVGCECGYSALVSAQRDAGTRSVTETVTCRDCRELVDVMVAVVGSDDPTPLRRCPRCQGARLAAWTPGGDCPRCAEPMRDPVPVGSWD